jgi:hypothetical protein
MVPALLLHPTKHVGAWRLDGSLAEIGREQSTLCSHRRSLQWADPSSLEVLLTSIDEITTVPCLVLLTARPDFVPAWPTRDRHTNHSHRLEPDETCEIIRDRMGPIDLADDMIEAL